MEFNFHSISNQVILNFPCKTMKIGTKIMIQINVFMHFLTMDEEKLSTTKNVPRK